MAVLRPCALSASSMLLEAFCSGHKNLMPTSLFADAQSCLLSFGEIPSLLSSINKSFWEARTFVMCLITACFEVLTWLCSIEFVVSKGVSSLAVKGTFDTKFRSPANFSNPSESGSQSLNFTLLILEKGGKGSAAPTIASFPLFDEEVSATFAAAKSDWQLDYTQFFMIGMMS